MDSKDIIEKVILQYDICEYVFGGIGELHFSDKTWLICKMDCEFYGKSWGCPPYCGDIQESIDKCKQYQNYCLFSTVVETENSWDYNANVKAKKHHEDVTRAIWKDLKDKSLNPYILSTRCTTCEVCACPNEPCRHPDERLSSMESHGIMVMQNVDEAGLTHNFGDNTMVYFGLILY
ncbi:hypothetical protein P261_01108 [Lachnospiraceae bacterium TWA4]|nr:hypothetical protein P261_01108 [Lachnospiraceae bacterium TWA4]